MPSIKSRKPVRYAVVGLGHIAQTAVLPAFRHATRDAELAALVSGDELKLRRLGRRYGVENLFRYDEFGDLLLSGLVDAIYVALPNHLHAEYALRALRAGIPVLCEKPLALTEKDCRALVRASRKSGAPLMTAYRLHFEHSNLRAIRAAREELGELRYFTSSFSYQLRDRSNIRLEAAEGGSPLWDLGVYCVNAARYFFRSEPQSVFAVAGTLPDARFREVAEMVSVTMKFPGERLASFTCSFGAADVADYEVVGTKGKLTLKDAYEYATPHELRLVLGGKGRTFRYEKADQFAAELVYFSRCLREARAPESSGLEGWADVRVILAAEKSLRSGRPVRLGKAPAELRRKPRPTLRQWIERPPVPREPPPVHVHAPGA
jgi:predicted dehydrogenase